MAKIPKHKINSSANDSKHADKPSTFPIFGPPAKSGSKKSYKNKGYKVYKGYNTRKSKYNSVDINSDGLISNKVMHEFRLEHEKFFEEEALKNSKPYQAGNPILAPPIERVQPPPTPNFSATSRSEPLTSEEEDSDDTKELYYGEVSGSDNDSYQNAPKLF